MISSWKRLELFDNLCMGALKTRSSSREVRIRVPFFSAVYLSRGTLPQKRNGKRALLDDIEKVLGWRLAVGSKVKPIIGLNLCAC